jgi:hypothetical protein
VYAVVFPRPTIGIKLAATRVGIRIIGFTNDFDKVVGQRVAVGDYLIGVAQTDVSRMTVEAVLEVLRATKPPRTLRFLRRPRATAAALAASPASASQVRHEAYTAVFHGTSVGLRLAATRLGLRVNGFTDLFDKVCGVRVYVWSCCMCACACVCAVVWIARACPSVPLFVPLCLCVHAACVLSGSGLRY